ncbi:MAG: hypothetical protein V1692_02990 [bacterium]
MSKVISLFGLDIVFSRMIAALLTIITLLFAPWLVFHYLLGTRKLELSLTSVVLIIGGALIIYHGSANVFFDRATGQPVKYYVKTLEGFKFSNTPDFDPMVGVKYKPINADIIRDYYFWEKNGRYSNLPEVTKGKYFDITTGEPIVWYAERAEGTRALFPLPGYDPLTGKALKPITAEIAEAMVSAAKEQEVKPQSSYGWVINDTGELVANLQPGEENTRPFFLQAGQSTPWIVVPSGNYDFRFTNLQTVIVEWNGHSRAVNPNDDLDLGRLAKQRVRLTALKGGAQISLIIKRVLQIAS